ncbi:TerC family protein [Bordetella avium]|uniref:Membrane protein n=1 Tax=Bordetella avium (strain 197N) TaxID=360910 RepID=Q2L0L8_BORA1|nr:transporter associated domain-containing protein [Bordetella avium]AZY49221.1 CBS domain-containing protein [Bordetella avium]AZY52577.1 CBS domain-containing protein [Bordetella avium]RIQ12701.1 CBS domain-containing protein [Bordetella avium]RIQ19261.1 CBS domain-containing protein [Bordetella avium]RIQ33429.1 CBS domain-containing protein [Bordetella avium]
MLFDWMSDPTAWVGLATLIVLEIVLGIDNLVFIAILADKLPAHQRNQARMLGLTLALVMRLGLLASIAWVVTLTAPLFTVLGAEISGRDLILIFGGLFLLFKGTMELHERVEGRSHVSGDRQHYAVFWQVIAQIVVLDAVFSLDSVITAVGMVQDLSIMMTAVVVAMVVMMLASRPLMAFVGRHPTVVILCLGLLLMIGFSLVAEGLGYEIPKGYLYAAIGFAILIEVFNQLAQRNRDVSGLGRRERTARAVLKLLRGGRESTAEPDMGLDEEAAFAPEESSLIEGVLSMGERDLRSIMVPRGEMVWLDVKDDAQTVLNKFASGHSRLPLCDGDPANVVGVLHFKDVLGPLRVPGAVDLIELAQEPHYVPETVPVIKLLAAMRESRDHLLIVVDEHGVCEGLVTPMDLLTAVAGDLPEHPGDTVSGAAQMADGSWLLDGRLATPEAARIIGAPELVLDYDDDATLAGCVLRAAGSLPIAGGKTRWRDWEFEVTRLDGRRIAQVHARRLA